MVEEATNKVKTWNREPGERWEKGIAHHPESLKLFKEIEAFDFNFNNDYFCWKSGGDGDNGESLMYVLDMIFERRDEGKCAGT